MTIEGCGTVRELIPDVVGSRLPVADVEVVERHAAQCADCAAELALARAIHASRVTPPPQLVGRLLQSVGAIRHRPTRTWWGLSAAAIAALALGIGISSDASVPASLDVPGYAYEVEEGDIWLSDDGLVAGAPLFDGLTDDALLQLLDELALATTGGSA